MVQTSNPGLEENAAAKNQKLPASCTGVKDFGACLGNTDNFCPTSISCQCKNEKPFCRCDYYRVDWQEYWYMGPKCNHRWNTLDFILVATLPAVALVIIAVVIFYCVYRCKSKKAGNQMNSPYREAHQNHAFTPETAGNLGHGYQQSPRDVWVEGIPKPVLRRQDLDDVLSLNQAENCSPVHLQPLSRPDAATGYFSNQRHPSERFGYPSANLPYADYAAGRQYQKY
ncbi:uncharacterized protein LOC134174872 [Pezoporus occidentalis]|uniref:uncharacterized protein LOC134174872 n=1 Tax=Pezoporus occidentalis TaxID=407982 RepID=UPI002F917151